MKFHDLHLTKSLERIINWYMHTTWFADCEGAHNRVAALRSIGLSVERSHSNGIRCMFHSIAQEHFGESEHFGDSSSESDGEV